MESKPIILSNTIIDREAGIILERDPDKPSMVRLYMHGFSEPHLFQDSDAHELWKFYDDRKPEWKS